jgi:glutaminyl-peptide cyclotransferase
MARVGLISSLLTLMLAACNAEDDTAAPLAEPTPTATPAPTPSPTPTSAPSPTPSPTPAPTPSPTPTPEPALTEYGYEIVNTFPHDPRAFTQGLEYLNGYLYESTGLRGESSLRRVNLETGEVVQMRELDDEHFGEGLTIFDGRIFQLTWQAGVGFIYDLETFDLIGEFSYQGEGWGLTNDGDRLIMSDGSNTLFFRDPDTFEEIGKVDVYDDHGPVMMLNELEYIEGEVWANIWLEDVIVVIDPESGQVTRRINLTGLLQPEDQGDRRVDVLNGIAYDQDQGRIFVTGKLWPALYEIELVTLD